GAGFSRPAQAHRNNKSFVTRNIQAGSRSSRMHIRVVLSVLLAGTTLAAQKAPSDGDSATSLPALESFSVASYEGQSWLIIDVQPVRPNGSKVRFIQVHRACGSARVHEIDHVFE